MPCGDGLTSRATAEHHENVAFKSPFVERTGKAVPCGGAIRQDGRTEVVGQQVRDEKTVAAGRGCLPAPRRGRHGL